MDSAPAVLLQGSEVDMEPPPKEDVEQGTEYLHVETVPKENIHQKNEQPPLSCFDQMWTYLTTILIVFLSLIGLTIVFAVMIVIPGAPIASIVMGAKYLGHCPAEPFIAIDLIVWGCFAVINILLGMRQRATSEKNEGNIIKCLEAIACPFATGWFIGGSIRIYGLRDMSTDPKSPNFCEPRLYWYSFWTTTVCYILFGILCVLVCLALFKEKRVIILSEQEQVLRKVSQSW